MRSLQDLFCFIYTPVSFEQPTHTELIPPIDPHQREAADARFVLVRAHQYGISLAESGFEPLNTDVRGSPWLPLHYQSHAETMWHVYQHPIHMTSALSVQLIVTVTARAKPHHEWFGICPRGNPSLNDPPAIDFTSLWQTMQLFERLHVETLPSYNWF